MASKELAAAEALKHFKGRGIKVQTATPAKVRGDDGKVRESFKAGEADLAEAHVIGARKYDDGRVRIVTIDGKRHEAQARGE